MLKQESTQKEKTLNKAIIIDEARIKNSLGKSFTTLNYAVPVPVSLRQF